MAKHESTAVNDLINLVSTQKPLPPDPSDDLMFTAPKVAPRTTASIPSLRPSEVEPLPRARAAAATQQPIRMSTAPASRAMSIPPMPQAGMDKARMIPTGTPPPASMPSPEPRRTSGRMSIPPPVPTNPRQTIMGAGPASSPAIVSPANMRSTIMGTGASPTPSAPAHETSLGMGTSELQQRPTKPSLPPPFVPISTVAPARPTAPSMMPVVAPFESAPRAFAQGSLEPFAPGPAAVDMTAHQEWFEHSSPAPMALPETHHTEQVARRADWKQLAAKLVAPTLGLVVVGVFIGGFFAFNGEGGRKDAPAGTKPVAANEPVKAVAPAMAEPAKPEPVKAEPVKAEPVKAEPVKAEPVKTETATEPVTTEPVKVPAKAEVAKTEPAVLTPVTPPNLAAVQTGMVDVRIDTTPVGATVMLVDRGKTLFLGSTPITTSVDVTRQYDLVFTYTNKPTQLEHFDPRTSHHVAVVLGKPSKPAAKTTEVEIGKAPKVAVAVTAPKVTTPKVTPPPKAHLEVAAPDFDGPRKLEAPKVEAPKVEAPKVEAPKKAVSGDGTLMISSKPPCEIFIDGKPTGLTTPQRSIVLPAGTHRITLVNTTENINKTVAVSITPDQPTKVIQNLMK